MFTPTEVVADMALGDFSVPYHVRSSYRAGTNIFELGMTQGIQWHRSQVDRCPDNGSRASYPIRILAKINFFIS